MTFHYRHLFQLLGEPKYGKHQWNGKHFIAVVHYAQLQWNSNHSKSEHDRFAAQLKELDSLALDYFIVQNRQSRRKFLEIIISLMPELREFFTVPKMPGTAKTNQILAAFIQFLLEPLKYLSVYPEPWIVIPSEIDALSQNLKFLLAILGDTPFQCTEREETKNILAKIEFTANHAGNFLFSFFFTRDPVKEKIERELSILLRKFKTLEAKINDHCIKFLEMAKVMTPNISRCVPIFIVDSVLDDLNHLMNHKANLTVDTKNQVTTLHGELNFSRAFLRDKGLQQNEKLIECETQLTDLAYEAEYIVTWFIAGDVPVWYLALRLSSFIQKNKLIMAALQEIELNCDNRNIEVQESTSEISSLVAKSVPLVDEIIVGFEDMTTQIARQLVGGPAHLQIISIIGMGGIGKTTLAKKLYNHSSIVSRFDKFSSCVVSQTYHKRKLLIDILSSISNLNENEMLKKEEDALALLLYKNLKGIRYLLVIDDIWNTEAWDDMRRYFPDDTNGSRILLTSRNKDVALQASSDHDFIHELPLLSIDESWDLLQQRVFQNGLCPPELQDVGNEIAESCKGLPLAVVGIAAILANMAKEKSLWEEVASNLSSYISKHQDILELSYKYLPSHLKPCFLYLGIFDEDSDIPVRKLVALWISQGYIPKKKEKSLQDVAEDFLMELINRNMIQVAKRRCDNDMKTCHIHDLILDMCMRIANEENFLNVIDEELSMYEQHLHLCVPFDSDHYKSRSYGLHIRSVLDDFSDFFVISSTLKLLRVLKLSNPEITLHDGTILEFLVQLRYLEFAGCLSNFTSHSKLEFLFVGDLSAGKVLLNMPKLRHLHFRKFQRFYKNLDILQTNSLETLSGIYIEDLKDEERLRCFSHLCRLNCVYLYSRNVCVDISPLTQLESLKMRFRASFVIKTIKFPITIKTLSLSEFILTRQQLSSIGRLPNLEILKLYSINVKGLIWQMKDDEFQKLKFLKLDFPRIQQWKTSRDHLPCLERLVLMRCYLGVPLSELGYIPTLQMIEVYDCSSDVRKSAKRVWEEQQEEGNEELKVIIL